MLREKPSRSRAPARNSRLRASVAPSSATSCRELERLLRRRRADFLPVLKDPVAPRSRREFCRARATGWAPAGAFMGRVDNFVYSAGQLTGIRSAFGNCVHFFRSRVWIDGKLSCRVRADAALLRKSKCVAIGNQNCVSSQICRHRFSVHNSTSQLPGSRQPLVISLSGGRLHD